VADGSVHVALLRMPMISQRTSAKFLCDVGVSEAGDPWEGFTTRAQRFTLCKNSPRWISRI
jgi:hypothetical protein